MSEREQEISPGSGRPQIAQRFIAGMRRHFLDQVREADGRNRSQLGVREISAARSTGFSSFFAAFPPLKCWAIAGPRLGGLLSRYE